MVAFLLLNNTQIPILSDSARPLFFSYAVASGNELAAPSGSRVYDIQIAATSDVNVALGFGASPSSEDITYRRYNNTVIYIDGIPVLDGACRLVSAVERGGITKSYRLSFVGGQMDWANLIGTKSVRGLQFTSWGAQYWDQANYADDPDDTSKLLTWPIVNYGKWDQQGTIPPGYGAVAYFEMFPAIRKSAVLTQMFADIGYQLESNWNDLDDPFLLYTSGQLKATQAYLDYASARVSLSSDTSVTTSASFPFIVEVPYDDDFTPPNHNSAGNYSNPYFTAPYTRKYKFKAFINGGPLVLTPTFYDALINQELTLMVYQNTASSVYIETDWIEVPSGNKIACILKGAPSTSAVVPAGSWFEVVLHEDAAYGDEINPATIMNEMTCIDFLRGLVHTSNLFMYANSLTRKVTIEPRDPWIDRYGVMQDGFYPANGIPQVIEFDNDSDCEVQIMETIDSSIRMQFKQDSNDVYLNQYVMPGSDSDPIFSALFDNGVQTKDDVIVSENPVFTPFYSIVDDQIYYPPSGRPMPIIPRLWSAKWDKTPPNYDYPPKSYNWEPKLAYCIRNYGAWSYLQFPPISGTIQYSQYTYAFIAPIFNNTGVPFNASLSYGDQQMDVGQNFEWIHGRMKRFYFRELMSRRMGITINAPTYMPLASLQQWQQAQWRVRFWVKSQLFTALKVDYAPDTTINTMTLLKDVPPTEADRFWITSNNHSIYANP